MPICNSLLILRGENPVLALFNKFHSLQREGKEQGNISAVSGSG